jgi:hypothetical protein
LHPDRFQWHNDNPDHDGLWALRHLDLSYIQQVGYVNLRCAWDNGCPAEIFPTSDEQYVPPAFWGGIFTNQTYGDAFQELFPGWEVPEVVGAPCCAQFAATRDAILRHPREDYVRWREWILRTPLVDELSGRVFEYAWHSK